MANYFPFPLQLVFTYLMPQTISQNKQMCYQIFVKQATFVVSFLPAHGVFFFLLWGLKNVFSYPKFSWYTKRLMFGKIFVIEQVKEEILSILLKHDLLKIPVEKEFSSSETWNGTKSKEIYMKLVGIEQKLVSEWRIIKELGVTWSRVLVLKPKMLVYEIYTRQMNLCNHAVCSNQKTWHQ